jgi:hypothetical protein
MGETLHCYGYSNSRILWKPYLGARLEYRYPSEAWQTITPQNGGELTYTTEIEKGKCNTYYRLFGSYYSKHSPSACNVTRYWAIDILGPINTIDGFSGSQGYWQVLYNGTSTQGGFRHISNANFAARDLSNNALGAVVATSNICIDITGNVAFGTTPIVFLDMRRKDSQPDNCGNCVFRVFEDGIEVFSRTESTCPEVDTQGCELFDGDSEGIAISKQGNQLVLVTDQEYSVNPQGYVVTTPLADNQLNVYKVTPKGDIDSNNSYELIEQIASECQDKRPEYQVNCLGKETCPPNTCEVDCGNHICCYDKNGYPVKTIQK